MRARWLFVSSWLTAAGRTRADPPARPPLRSCGKASTRQPTICYSCMHTAPGRTIEVCAPCMCCTDTQLPLQMPSLPGTRAARPRACYLSASPASSLTWPPLHSSPPQPPPANTRGCRPRSSTSSSC